MENQEKKYIEVGEYKEETKTITSKIAGLGVELDKIINEINVEANELQQLKGEKELIKEKTKKIKKAIFKLKSYLFFQMLSLRKLKKRVKILNNQFESSYDEEAVYYIDIKEYGLSDYENGDNQLLTPELYERIANKLSSRISKTKISIEEAERKLEGKQDVLTELKIEKKTNKGKIANKNKRLTELRNYKLEKFATMREKTTEFEYLNKVIVKTKKR